jgi:hypothetical protein
MTKYRYEFPAMEPHFVEAPSVSSVVTYIKRIYPHNFDEVLPTLVEIPDWPEFWRVLDEGGRVVPRIARPQS